MHKLIKIPKLLKDKEDKSLFIVGGGPSLIDFDWALLKDKNVLVINRAFQKVPNALGLFWNDVNFHKIFEKEIDNFKGIKMTTTRYGMSHTCDCDIIWVKGRSYLADLNGPIEESPYVIRQGGNTGYSALNVAYHLGAKTIYLLGYDMKLDNNKMNWHDGYPDQIPTSARTESFLMVFLGANETYEEKGIKIYNVNSNSNLTEFETKTIQQVFA